MKVIRERVFDSDVTVFISEGDEFPLLVAQQGETLAPITSVENQWMLNNGYERVAGHNGGFFITSNGVKLGVCMTDWGNYQSTDVGWEDGIVDVAYDGDKLVVGDIATSKQYQWCRTMSWGIIKNGVKWSLGADKYTHDTQRNPRTMIGTTNKGEFISIIVDGRNMASKIKSGSVSLGVTHAQQYELALRYNCKDLVNCDGGGSSVAQYNGQILNNPSDGKPRNCSDYIIYYRKKQSNGGNSMAQRLILPINKTRLTAGYKNANYKKQFGYVHYGVDCTDKDRKDKTVWGSGIGEVTHAGWDNTAGNCVVIVYRDCLLTDGRVRDLAIRYFHLDSINVKVGQKISKDTRIGNYGNTGYSSGAHLHIEIDTDVKYPNYSPQVSKSGAVIKAGTDSTINPVTCLYAKTSSPDYQSVTNAGYDTVASSDLKYTQIK